MHIFYGDSMTSEERRAARYKRRKAKREAKKKEQMAGLDDFGTVFSYDNMVKAYCQCRKGVKWKPSTQKFTANYAANIAKLKNELENGGFRSRGFYEFDLMERGKLRHIKSVHISERVVQRCLCDSSLVPAMSRTFIYDNGASLKGKGYTFTRARLTAHLQRFYRKHGCDGYALIIDFRHFFDNVSHAEIKRAVERAYTDTELVDQTMHFVKCFGGRGLGLGSQISQILALASVNRLDHYITEKLGAFSFDRYMDDSILLHPSKKHLKECLVKIRKACRVLGITINEKKTQIVKLSHGFAFMKTRYKLTPTGKVVRKIYKKSVAVERRKLKKLKAQVEAGHKSLDAVRHSISAWLSYACQFNAWHAIYNILKLYKRLFGEVELNALQNSFRGSRDRRTRRIAAVHVARA